MGSYFFRDCSLGGLECEEDLHAAKYISTKADYIEFAINEYNKEKGFYVRHYFKYIYQKFKFTDKLHKIKIKIRKNVTEKEITEILLDIQKYANKFIFCKKWRKLPSWNNYWKNGNNDPLKPENWDNDFIIKVDFDDAKYRIKKVKYMKDKTPQLNYFGLFTLTKKYEIKDISEFYLNRNLDNYDYLLPINITPINLVYLYEYLNHFVETYKVNNLMLPPFTIDFNIENELIRSNNNKDNEDKDKKLKLMIFDKILFLQNTQKVTFFDLSFIIYLKEENQLQNYIDYFKIKLQSIENFILRIYIITDITSDKSLIIKNFLKSSINFPKRENSHVIIYLFNKAIYSLSLKSDINPFSVTSVLSNNINSQLQSNHKKIGLITNKVYKYSIKLDIPFMSVMYSTYTKYSILKKIRKKTILYRILINLGVIPYETIYEGEKEDTQINETVNNESQILLNHLANNNSNNSDKTKRKYIVKKVLNLSKEYVIPVNNNPKGCKQLHSDLVHCHFDYVFNLLRSSDKN